MYGNPDELDRLAGDIRREARLVREALAERLSHAQTAEWHSSAADSWRATVHEETRQGQHNADQLDEAAAALIAHAQRCREVLAEIAAVEAQIKHWLHNRWHDLRSAAHWAADAAVDGVQYVGNAAIDGADYVENAAIEGTRYVGNAAIEGTEHLSNAAIDGAHDAADAAERAADEIKQRISELPVSGSLEWLNLPESFNRIGRP